jgi:hypothetical protein
LFCFVFSFSFSCILCFFPPHEIPRCDSCGGKACSTALNHKLVSLSLSLSRVATSIYMVNRKLSCVDKRNPVISLAGRAPSLVARPTLMLRFLDAQASWVWMFVHSGRDLDDLNRWVGSYLERSSFFLAPPLCFLFSVFLCTMAIVALIADRERWSPRQEGHGRASQLNDERNEALCRAGSKFSSI